MVKHVEPLVSVVMAVHNPHLTELQKSCYSILGQTYSSIEFIIVDDGNTETVCEFLRDLSTSHDTVSILKNSKNRGLTYSLVKGIKHAKGTYIARQDADDFSSNDRIKEQVKRFQEDQSVCLLGTAYLLENEMVKTTKIQCHALSHANLIKQMFSINPFCHTSVMFTKKHYLLAGGYNIDYRTSQDFDLWFRMAKIGTIANLPTALVTRRLTDQSLSSIPSKALEQIHNGFFIRLREKEMYTGNFFYLKMVVVYLRSVTISVIALPLLSKFKKLGFK